MKDLITQNWIWIVSISILLVITTLTGCSTHYYLEGEALANRGAYTEATDQFERALNGNKRQASYEALAEIYQKLNSHERALACMDSLIIYGGLTDKMHFDRAETLLALGRYDEASSLYESLASTVGNDAETSKMRLASLGSLNERQKDSVNYILRTVEIESVDENGTNITSAASPFIIGDKLYFTAERPRMFSQPRGSEKQFDNYTENRFMDLWEAEIVDTTGLGSPIILKAKPVENLNTDLHDGFVSYIKGHSTGVISKTYDQGAPSFKEKIILNAGAKYLKTIQLFDARLIEDSQGSYNWEMGNRLSFCDDRYMFAHPALSPSGNSLYFTSNKPDGYGGMDIWRVDREGDGWGNPKNCGGKVNTSEDEAFPSLRHADTLYFSSDGHLSIGGLDIVYATKQGDLGLWSDINDKLPHPINSTRDDFGVQLDETGVGGYFSSDRTGVDAIYYYYGDNSKIMLNVKIVHDKDGVVWPGVNAELITNSTDIGDTQEDGESFVSDKNGGWSKIVERGANYRINCPGNSGYTPEWFEVTSDKEVKEFTVTVRLPLIPEVGCTDPKACNYNANAPNDDGSCEYRSCNSFINYSLEEYGIVEFNINWAYNKEAVSDENMAEITLFADYMLTNMDTRVLLVSHCDTRASAMFNDALSQGRALALKEILITKGVDAGRVISFGASEQFPRNECLNGVKCSEEKHQENRRTTAKIILEGEKVRVHKVLAGELLGFISTKYGVSSSDIIEWNGIKNRNLREGQQLLLYLSE